MLFEGIELEGIIERASTVPNGRAIGAVIGFGLKGWFFHALFVVAEMRRW